MIQSKEELAIVRKQLARIQDALESLRERVLPKNKRNFEVFSEGYVDQIAELQKEIDAYERAANKTGKASTKNGKRGGGRKAS